MNLLIITRFDIIRRLDAPPRLARLTLHTTEITGTPGTIAQARAAFGRTHAVVLPGFLAPDLLSYVRREIERDGFFVRVHDALPSRPTDLQLNRSLATGMLILAVNDARFLALVRRVTGDAEIKGCTGTIARRVPGAGHDDAWHSDAVEDRIAVLSINVGAEVRAGGLLQIREGADGPIVFAHQNTTPGDALIFRVDPRLKHHVSPPEDAPRTVFAGFFRARTIRQALGFGARV
jgi:hypothetical protein